MISIGKLISAAAKSVAQSGLSIVLSIVLMRRRRLKWRTGLYQVLTMSFVLRAGFFVWAATLPRHDEAESEYASSPL